MIFEQKASNFRPNYLQMYLQSGVEEGDGKKKHVSGEEEGKGVPK